MHSVSTTSSTGSRPLADMPTDTERRDVVLLVDDAPDSLRMLAAALEDEGFTVLVATDGQRALERLDHVIPNVVLLDARMPGMDGFETCRRLREHPDMAAVPILFMTGMGDTDSVVEGLDAGGNDYLVKPVLPAELSARIRAHLRVARKTTSAFAALDATGMALASFDQDGRLEWATPSARALLDQPSVDITEAVRQWLAGPSHQPLEVQVGCGRLACRSLGRSSRGLTLTQLDPMADESRPRAAELTPRETDVLEWVAKGKTNRDIGDILGMSPRTVNKHLEHIYAKLGVETRTAAVAQFDRLQQNRQ